MPYAFPGSADRLEKKFTMAVFLKTYTAFNTLPLWLPFTSLWCGCSGGRASRGGAGGRAHRAGAGWPGAGKGGMRAEPNRKNPPRGEGPGRVRRRQSREGSGERPAGLPYGGHGRHGMSGGFSESMVAHGANARYDTAASHLPGPAALPFPRHWPPSCSTFPLLRLTPALSAPLASHIGR